MDQIIFGIHAVKSALNYISSSEQEKALIQALYIDRQRKDQRIHSLTELAKKKSVTIHWVNRKKLDQLCQENHQGIVAISRVPEIKNETYLDELLQHLETPPFLLVLDEVQDPHNLGACLRTADAAGVDAVVVPKDRSSGFTPVVRKVACGADQNVPLIQVTNLARTLKLLKTYQIQVLGLAGEAQTRLYQARLTGAIALVLGAEAKGLRRLTRENCDQLLTIPMSGQVESLNVSVAAGVSLFEAVRQRHYDAG